MAVSDRELEKHGPATRQILVEGVSDQHFLWNLLQRHGISGDPIKGFQVHAKGGYTRLREDLPTRLKAGNQTHLGIIVDADHTDEGAGCRNRWVALRDVLRNAGYDAIPDDLPEVGLIVPGNQRQRQPGAVPQFDTRVGVWVMPDNVQDGALEEHVARMISPTDTLWPTALEAVGNLPEYRFGPTYHTKARVETWLAWQEKPGEPVGVAISQNWLRHDAPTSSRLVAWIRQLFEL